ncbi:DUF1330 domain-containing protein [Burkholderia sp. L27(2015)]|jgi:uncharacterized protein (DUF1330 family)|uniref:DUF1330 domain-containing protein n=1 Tax=Burkholderia sp. L27(2015) TaxID=1641858 RepID=UPI00131E2C2D|nr:DUF1330 domain-containing protein [Burkholderia sp. L27(2015)]
MKKGYWISCYRSVSNPDALKAYAGLATVAVEAGGGRFLARGVAAQAHGVGVVERAVIIEFDSLERAIEVYEGDAYKAALTALGNGVERDFRIVEGA